ncbi:MAG TPA: nuclear transport factor 2 family protein [Chitinophagaceae bacterium]|nr:nuclear transport factor 2 family protein [Chitinophagaceae bacterium]
MKYIFILLTFLNYNAFSQENNDKVKEPILHFFEGMKKGDSMLLKSSLAPSAILQTIAKTKEGNTVVRTENIAAFITAVTKPHEGVYDERIKFDLIKVDSDLAMVWTPYQFFVSDNFSHCGVNSFQLVKLNGEWKIQYIIDTRRKDNCL